MQHPNPLTRADTLLGVCQAIGEDMGFNPTLLRIGFAAMLFWKIELAVAAYLGLGLVALAVRLLLPSRAAEPVMVEAMPVADNDAAETLPLAA